MYLMYLLGSNFTDHLDRACFGKGGISNSAFLGSQGTIARADVSLFSRSLSRNSNKLIISTK